MANSWLRLWHDMPTDPKFKTIARKSGQPLSVVHSTYLYMLVSASKASERGRVEVLAEEVAADLNVDDSDIEAVYECMQGRLLDGDRLTGWERRQPEREDGSTGGKPSSGSYIYYVGTTGSPVVKVGFSRNPWARVKDLQTGSSEKYRLLATIKTNSRSEKAIREKFKASCKTGEWYYRSNALNRLIDGINTKEIKCESDAIEFLSGLDESEFELLQGATGRTTVATKDKEKDKEEDKEKEDKKNKQKKSAPEKPKPKTLAEKFKAPPDVTREQWQAYLEARKYKGRPMTAGALELFVTAFVQTSEATGFDHKTLIEQATIGGWQTIKPEYVTEQPRPGARPTPASTAARAASIVAGIGDEPSPMTPPPRTDFLEGELA